MKKFLLNIITPKGTYLHDEVEEVYLKTSNGYLGILANHDSLISVISIAPGFIVRNQKKEYFAFFGGVMYVNHNEVKLIVNNIEHADSIDEKRAQAAHDRAVERLKKKEAGMDTKRAELALKKALARLGTIRKDFL